jgi:hypothetical protein
MNQIPKESKGGLDESSPYIQEDMMNQIPPFITNSFTSVLVAGCP